jgi:hypothetical protein
MKIQFLLFFLLFVCCSCKQGKVKKSNEDSLLVGKWGIYSTIEFQNNDDSIATICNVCPEMIFAKDETGFIRRQNEKMLHFKWESGAGTLILKHSGSTNNGDNIIGDGNYKLIYKDKKSFKEIALIDTFKDIKYILRK